MENEHLIREQMSDTRASLTEKLENLEEQVVGTVQGTTTAVRDTVEAIKESVEETVSTVKDSVKEGVNTVKDWMDVKAHVQHHPLIMTGGSVLLGYCLGKFFPQRQPQGDSAVQTIAEQCPSSNGAANGAAQEQARKEGLATPNCLPSEASAESASNNLLSELAPEIQKLKGLAVGTLLGTIREMVLKISPEHMGEQLREIIDSMTQKLGGDVIPSSDWAECPLKSAQVQKSSKGDDHEESVETKMGRPLGSTQGQGQEIVGEFDR